MPTAIRVPMYCPACYTTLACEARVVTAYLPGAPTSYTAVWCPAVGCGQYYRTVSGAEFVQMPERDQNMLRWLLDRTESRRGW